MNTKSTQWKPSDSDLAPEITYDRSCESEHMVWVATTRTQMREFATRTGAEKFLRRMSRKS